MKKYRINKSHLYGEVVVPPSKSHTLRAILFAMMANGKSIVRSYLKSPDTEAMIDACRCFGAKIEIFQDRLEIIGVNGKLPPAENVIQSGNSGQVLRFIGALGALNSTYTVITGDHSIRHNRPVQPMLEALEQLGALATSSRLDGYAPIIVKGPMKPGKATLSGEDSQPISALLIACSFLSSASHIHVKNPGEKPWIDLTLSWLDRFNIKYKNENYEHYTVFGNASYQGFDITIPGDFSSAAYPIAAALVTKSDLTIHNIDMDDVQGDKKLIATFIKMGADITYNDDKKILTVKGSKPLHGIKVDINDFIDAITIVSVIGCYAEGTTEIVNASIARKKESDRIYCIATELKKMGAKIEERPDGLVIKGSPLKGSNLLSYHDHRMVLSLSIAALGAKDTTVIENVDCVAKTYPTFAKEFKALGADIEEFS